MATPTRYEHVFRLTLTPEIAVPGGTTRDRRKITREEIIRATLAALHEWDLSDVEGHIAGAIDYVESCEISPTGDAGGYYDSDEESQ